MQHQKMIVLGLIAMGRRYGFQMEEFIDETDMRRWVQIGTSTVYKVLNDLSADGAIEGTLEPSDKGPKRKAYRLTSAGRAQLKAQVLASLQSDASVYSDRIAGLIFAPLLKRNEVCKTIETSKSALSKVDASLRKSLEKNKNDLIAEAIIQFYRDVYVAEQKAMEKILQNLKTKK